MSDTAIAPVSPPITSDETIKVYGKTGCMPCRSTKKFLESKGVEFEYLDIAEDPSALAAIQDLGYSGVPVIVVGDQHWQGYAPDRLAALAA